MNKNICNNCGKFGHMFHQCKLPVTSYGIIAFRMTENNQREYLMIRRKDSFGYIDFIRGKYSINNIEQIQQMFNEMSVSEKEKIMTEQFSTLWKVLWGETTVFQNKNDELSSYKKYDMLKNGVLFCNKIITLENLINNSTTQWEETEWEFPKGRRNYQERDMDCAKREFEEETGYNRTLLSVIENVTPFEEIFIGSNHKSYKHKYYLAHMDTFFKTPDDYQQTEVSKVHWKSLDECLESIRPYNLEKKQIIKNIDSILNEYTIC